MTSPIFVGLVLFAVGVFDAAGVRQTVDRILAELNGAHVVNSDCRVVVPPEDPEATLLGLTLAPSSLRP